MATDSAGTQVDASSKLEVDSLNAGINRLSEAIRMQQNFVHGASKASASQRTSTMLAAISKAEEIPNVLMLVSELKEALRNRISGIESDFTEQLSKTCGELGYALEGNYPAFILKTQTGRSTRFEVVEPFNSYLIADRPVKGRDIRIIVGGLEKKDSSRQLEEQEFRALIDSAYQMCALASKDKTVMLKTVLSLLNGSCNVLRIDADSTQQFSKLFFAGSLDDYEFFRSGGADTSVTLRYGENVESRTLMRRREPSNI